METLDSFSLVIGLIAVGMGLYELVTKQLIGRSGYKLTQQQVKKFLPYDVATYVIAGALLALTGAGEYLPFVKNTVFVIVSIVISLTVIGFNIYFTNKILGKPVQPTKHL